MDSARLVLAGAAFVMISQPSFGLSVEDLPARMQKDVACMRDAAKTMRGIDRVEISVMNAESWAEVGTAPWVHAAIDYRYKQKDGQTQTLRFEAHGTPRKYFFQVVLPGIYSPNTPGPPAWGTGAIIDKWKSRCGVDASAFYV